MPYDPKITLKKMGYQMLNAGVSAALVDGINFLAELPSTENGILFVVLLAVLRGIQNWWAHKDDK